MLADNPALTDRTPLPRRRPPKRVVLDSRLRIPLDSKLATTISDDLWIFLSEEAERAEPEKVAILRSRGAICIALGSVSNRLHLPAMLDELHAAGMRSVLLEAGSRLNAAFLEARLVDEAVLFYAPVELGPDAIPFARGGPTPFALEQQLITVDRQSVGPDVRISGLLHDPWATLPETS